MRTQPHLAWWRRLADQLARRRGRRWGRRSTVARTAASGTSGVAMHPGVLAWSTERGCIITPHELVAAVRSRDMVVAVDDDHVLRGVDGTAPLAAIARGDSDVVDLRQEMTHLTARVDDLHNRLVEIAEASMEVLARR